MIKDRNQGAPQKRRMLRRALFPGSVLLIYGILFIFVPDRASLALGSSFRVFLNILLPLCLVFSLMVFLNFFLKPPHIAEFLGKRGGVKGVLLTGTAGIISMGPIYAWYPLLRELRGRGVRNSLIAIFLGNRAVKPLLLPVLISYFGWTYAVTLALLTMVGSLAVGYTTGALVGDETGISGNELHERKNTEKTIPQKRINLCVSFYPLIYLS